MHPLPVLAGAAIVACASSFLVVKLIDAPPAPAMEPATGAPADGGRLDRIETMLDRIGNRLDALEAARVRTMAPRRAADEPVASSAAVTLAAAHEASAEPAASAVTVDALMADFAEHSGDYEHAQEVWRRAREAGLTDDLVARFEAAAKENPNDPDAQCALGGAYLQKIFTVPDGPEKGKWAIAADKAFDAALTINPQHWEARFSKATSLAFWPPIFGKGAEAVQQYETLMQQQETSGTSKPEYAQTYLFLGNLYQDQGNAEKAREIWQRGLQHNPQNSELQRQLGH